MKRIRFQFVLKILLAAVASAAWSFPALAAQEIVLISDQSQIVKLPQPPATLIVGNPAVADVTTDGGTLFFHPRGYGLTNVVALDSKGKKLADYLVRVIFEDSYSVSMYAPNGRETYSCRRDCEPSMRIGDEAGFFSGYSGQVTSKNSLAASQALGEDLLRPTTVTAITTTAAPAAIVP